MSPQSESAMIPSPLFATGDRAMLIAESPQRELAQEIRGLLIAWGASVFCVADAADAVSAVQTDESAYDLVVAIGSPGHEDRAIAALENVRGYYGGLVGVVLIAFNSAVVAETTDAGVPSVYWGVHDPEEQLAYRIVEELTMVNRKIRFT